MGIEKGAGRVISSEFSESHVLPYGEPPGADPHAWLCEDGGFKTPGYAIS